MSICPVHAIYLLDGKSTIDKDCCLECSSCFRSAICPTKAIVQERLRWPRIIRNVFSDVASSHKITGIPGCGTEEMKTNDVTNRFGPDEIGFSIELGRPGIGTRLGNVELFTTRLSTLGVEYERENPLTHLIADTSGHIEDDVKDERVLSAIIEFKIRASMMSAVLDIITEVEGLVDTVFTVGIISRAGAGGTIPLMGILEGLGFSPRPNAKVNVGLGRAFQGGVED